jgi:hypothetical protein
MFFVSVDFKELRNPLNRLESTHARHCVSVDCKEVRAPEALQGLFGRVGAYLE